MDHAIKAAKVLLQRGADIRLTIIGAGEMEETLKQLAGESGIKEHIKFTGRLDEQKKDEQLRRAHFLIHTSIREGWGLNVIEANAMGTPAVVYPVGGFV